MSRSNIIDVDVEITHRTDKAVRVHTGDKDDAVWLPISQIEVDETGATAVVTLPEWLAVEKGLI